MIKLITGVPGSGKTYLAVQNMIDQYYKKNNEGMWELKDSDMTVISNIEGLQIEHISLYEEIEKYIKRTSDELICKKRITDNEGKEDIIWNMRGAKAAFFEIDQQKKMSMRYGKIVYVVDECQEFFDTRLGRKKYARKVCMWFETHRHLGQDIILITQSSVKLAKDVRVLIENEVRALPKSLSILGEFKYNEYLNGIKANAVPKVVRPRKEIYAIYKSMNTEGVEKKSGALKRIAIIMIGCSVAAGLMLYYGIFKKYKPENKKIEYQNVGDLRKSENAEMRDKYVWMPVNWVSIGNDVKSIMIVDELRGLVHVQEYGRKLRFMGRNLYGRYEKNEIITSRNPGRVKPEGADPGPDSDL